MMKFSEEPSVEEQQKLALAYQAKPSGYAKPPAPTERPTGNNADEWALWFFEHAGYGAQYLGVQIAEAIDEHMERTALLDRAQVPRILLYDANQGIAIGGRWDGWLMFKHPDGQWVSVKKLQQASMSLPRVVVGGSGHD